MRIILLVVLVVLGCGGDVLVAAPEQGGGGGAVEVAPALPPAACNVVIEAPSPRLYGAADCAAAVELVAIPTDAGAPGEPVCLVAGDELVGVLTLVGPWRPGEVEYSARGAAGCAPIAGLPTPPDGSAWWQGMR